MSEATLSIEAAGRARISEDWLAVVIGVGVFALALLSIAGTRRARLGRPRPRSGPIPAQRARARLEGLRGLERRRVARSLTYLALLVVLSAGAAALGEDVKQFALAFTAVFAIAYASWFIGS